MSCRSSTLGSPFKVIDNLNLKSESKRICYTNENSLRNSAIKPVDP